jgi:excisionase family DNA binding protein
VTTVQGFLTLEQVARALRCHYYVARDLVEGGIIRGIRQGRRWLVDSDELADYSRRRLAFLRAQARLFRVPTKGPERQEAAAEE